MRIVRFHRHGGPEVLRLETTERPSPRTGEVRIKVKALGLNRAEALMRAGAYIEQPALPSGLGLEGAGVVDALGEGVGAFQPGDPVSIIPPISMAQWPTYAEYICVPTDRVVKHPLAMNWCEAAATWMACLTAYGALVDIANVGRYDPVAITAASSSVGLAAIQVANRLGAIPIAITRSDAKRQPLIEAGAAHVIVSSTEDVRARLQEITGPSGLRVVFDPIGGPILEPLTDAMANGGILIEYGGLSDQPTPFPLASALRKGLTLRGYLVHEVTGNAARLEAAKRFILDGLANGQLKPIIARVFPIDAIVEAHRYLESNTQFGKIVVTI
jgi:NADPH:quinone reductase-like Zn-dependent oxidoreductase